MNSQKIANAVERLERNLPLRHNQTRLPDALRQMHRWILRYYLEHGQAPGPADLDDVGDWQSGIDRLAAEHIIVLNDAGAIAGAYPFVDQARAFLLQTNYGPVHAMCAFDALAVSSMFALPVLIESQCRLSQQSIVIEQNRADIRVIEPAEPVFAAINWQAGAGGGSCADGLCTEMVFIAGENRAATWRSEDVDNRELFNLPAAHALITAVFVPLMQ